MGDRPLRVAAVDIGTNSCRLLVAEAADAGVRPVHRGMHITRLGQDVDATGRLADQAVARTVAAVTDHAARWRALRADRVRITATSAARDAANATAFLDAVTAVAGARPEVLTGEEEATAAFRGAVGALPDLPASVCVLDIGGGSTELIRGRVGTARHPGPQVEAMSSRQLGSVRLTERAYDGDPPSPAGVAAAQDLIDAELSGVAQVVDPAAADALVAVAGTATTMAALHLGLSAYEDGRMHATRIPAAAVHAMADRLRTLPAADIAALGPVQAGREDVLAAGAQILSSVVRRFDFAEVVVSEADILDGVARGLLEPGPVAAGAQLVEVVDDDGAVTDVITRAEVRRTGARHRCTYVVVVRSWGDVVVHQRAPWKDVSPSAWDLAFGGLCDVGEDWADAAARELAEEAGLTGVALVDLGAVRWSSDRSALVGHVFVARWDGPLQPADGEVVALDEIPAADLPAWVARTDTVDDSPDVVLPLLLPHLGIA